MSIRKELIFEVIAVGLLTTIFLWPTYYLVAGKFPDKEIAKMIIGSFLLGGSMHFVLEIIGLNEKWCRMTFT